MWSPLCTNRHPEKTFRRPSIKPWWTETISRPIEVAIERRNRDLIHNSFGGARTTSCGLIRSSRRRRFTFRKKFTPRPSSTT